MKNINLKNNTVFQVFIFLLVSICFGLIYKCDSDTPKKIDVSSALPVDKQLHYSLDLFSLKNGRVEASGWVCLSGEDYRKYNFAFLIKNNKTNEYYKIKTVSVYVPAVTAAMNDGFNYDNTGFIARGSVKKLPKFPYKPYFLLSIGKLKQYLIEFEYKDITENEYSYTTLPINNNSQGKPFHWLDYINKELYTGNEINIDVNSEYISIEGWALDGINDTTASQVVIQVGEEYSLANYGKERESVVNYFEKPQYLNSGYTANLNTKKVLDAGGFSVHVISADETYQYEPRYYSVIGVIK